jgi:N12 class adenine-specific DNA methylase
MNEYLDNEINVGQAKIDKEKALKVANDIFNNERPIYLEDLGIDHLTVDEAHNFRNLFNKAISDDED